MGRKFSGEGGIGRHLCLHGEDDFLVFFELVEGGGIEGAAGFAWFFGSGGGRSGNAWGVGSAHGVQGFFPNEEETGVGV